MAKWLSEKEAWPLIILMLLVVTARASDSVRIVGGLPTTSPSWLTLLHDSDSEDEFGCSAVLIHESWILTAAHCAVSATHFQHRETAWIGGSIKSNPDEFEKIPIDNFIIHPQFNYQDFDQDIALGHLAHPTKKFVAILNDDEELERPGLVLSVLGWGAMSFDSSVMVDQVRVVWVPLVDQSVCQKAMGYPAGEPTTICAGFKEGGYDSCTGDSGGPLYAGNTVIGIVSFGLDCAKPNRYGVYTRVSAMKPWIESQIAAYQSTPSDSGSQTETTVIDIVKSTTTSSFPYINEPSISTTQQQIQTVTYTQAKEFSDPVIPNQTVTASQTFSTNTDTFKTTSVLTIKTVTSDDSTTSTPTSSSKAIITEIFFSKHSSSSEAIASPTSSEAIESPTSSEAIVSPTSSEAIESPTTSSTPTTIEEPTLAATLPSFEITILNSIGTEIKTTNTNPIVTLTHEPLSSAQNTPAIFSSVNPPQPTESLSLVYQPTTAGSTTSTDNASISSTLVQMTTVNAGQGIANNSKLQLAPPTSTVKPAQLSTDHASSQHSTEQTADDYAMMPMFTPTDDDTV